jgi:hypothetical protein
LDNVDCVDKREPIGILISLQSSFMHETPNGKVRHQQTEKLLLHQFRSLAPQDDLGTPQMGLQLVQGGLSGKGLARC